jgi:hypothetical protein
MDASWSQPFLTNNHVSVGVRLSHELDDLVSAINAGISHDFNARRTTIGLFANLQHDGLKPPGGAPVPLSDYRLSDKGGHESKNTKGGMLSLTQLITPNWNLQLNYVFDKQDGYLTDPYKILSVIDAAGLTTDYIFENRPDSRTQKAVFLDNRVAIARTVLDVSFRHGSDDWGIRANTAEASLRFNVYGEDIYLEPHARWYHQTAATFYRLYADATGPQPTYISPDTRLAEFTAETFGVKLGFLLQDRNEVTLRLESYRQNPTERTSSLAGLSGLDLNPALRSFMFQIGFRHGF